MNFPYFSAEDELMRVASEFDGTWNAQVGFEFNGSPQLSLRSTLEAIRQSSPFTSFYLSEIVPEVLASAPQVVGFSIAAISQLIPALELCRLLRVSGFKGFIVLGGNTISRLANELAKPELFKIIDGLITFQGEIALLALCRAIAAKSSLTTVPQLVWRDDDIIRNNINTTSSDLNPDQVGPPDYQNLPLKEYWGSQYLCLVAARGCYYGRCSFCAIPYGWGNGGYAGVRSADKVYRDIKGLIQDYGVTKFKFVDEALSPSFMETLSRRLLDSGLTIQWEGYVRLESAWLKRDFVQLVSQAGFRKGYFGLEISSPQKRYLLNKKDNGRAEELAKICADYGVKVHFFCMFGFPGTGREEAEETVRTLIANQDYIDTVDIFPWTYAKHTAVPGVQILTASDKDLSLEFSHYASEGVMSSAAICELSSQYEELLWRNMPRWLHPTYRLISPWL